MWLELLDTKSDALLSFVELEDDDVELLIEVNHFAGVRYTAPREVGDVDKPIDTTEVDEGTVGGDVLDDPFEDLTLLELADDLSLLCFELGFDEDLMRYDDVLELLVDLDDLELHRLVYISIVVADRTDIDLRTREEGFDTEDINDHTTLGAALDVATYHFVLFEGFVDTIPRASHTSQTV